MQTRKWLITLVVAGVLTAMGLLIFKSRQPPSSPPLPSPNGYDDFVKARQMLVGDPSDYRTMSQQDLHTFVSKNAELLRILRIGLSRECLVPPLHSNEQTRGRLSETSGQINLARALAAEGRLAEMENRTNDAARAYLDVIRLAHESVRGGILTDLMVGLALEALGLPPVPSPDSNLSGE